MKYPKLSGILALAGTALLLTALTPAEVEARIGERREQLEGRLLRSGGILCRDEELAHAWMRNMPYVPLLGLFGGSVELRMYYKTADGRNPSSKDLGKGKSLPGWQMHVLYINGKSVCEVYKRSSGMSESELNQLLSVHAGSSYWKKQEKQEEEPEVVSFFGFEMVRDDGEVRAKKLGGDSIMLFDAKMDEHAKFKSTNDQLEAAPLSVEGF
ncbi:MAG: hypothetical protein ACI81V_000631 [Lentimonas sp.]|jgi:hypothetical protein